MHDSGVRGRVHACLGSSARDVESSWRDDGCAVCFLSEFSHEVREHKCGPHMNEQHVHTECETNLRIATAREERNTTRHNDSESAKLNSEHVGNARELRLGSSD